MISLIFGTQKSNTQNQRVKYWLLALGAGEENWMSYSKCTEDITKDVNIKIKKIAELFLNHYQTFKFPLQKMEQ